jgi:hypothetical protein
MGVGRKGEKEKKKKKELGELNVRFIWERD